MRYALFLLSLPLLFCFCKKDDTQVPTDPNTHIPIIELGKYAVLRNGKPYTGKLEALYRKYNGVKTVSIAGSLFTNNGLVEEKFSISDTPLRDGRYAVELSTVSNFGNGTPNAGIAWYVDTDQYSGDQSVDTTRTDHYLEMIRYDSVQHTVEGRFQVFFRQAGGTPPILPGIPDTISFTQGVFHLKISN